MTGTMSKMTMAALLGVSLLSAGACTRTQQMTTGGAVLGAATGGIVGAATGGSAVGGAVVGGAIGAGTGYILSK